MSGYQLKDQRGGVVVVFAVKIVVPDAEIADDDVVLVESAAVVLVSIVVSAALVLIVELGSSANMRKPGNGQCLICLTSIVRV